MPIVRCKFENKFVIGAWIQNQPKSKSMLYIKTKFEILYFWWIMLYQIKNKEYLKAYIV